VCSSDLPRNTEQTHLMVGHLGIRRDDPDYFAVMVMNEILGAGSFSSRLVERIRDTEGLAYHTGTAFTENLQRGLFYAVCQTKAESATRALSLILEEMERIRTTPVTQEELSLAKDSFANNFVFRFKTPSDTAEQTAALEFFGLPEDYLKTYLDRLAAVTADDVLRAARTHLHPDRATILILGTGDRFPKPLEAFGEVRVLPPPVVEPGPQATPHHAAEDPSPAPM